MSWDHVRSAAVVPAAALEELSALDSRGALDMDALKRVCAKYAPEIREAGMLPVLAPYWLAHHLKVQR